MCPLWPLHLILLYIVMLGPLWMLTCGVVSTSATKLADWKVTFNPEEMVKIIEGQTKQVEMSSSYSELQGIYPDGYVQLYSSDEHVAKVTSPPVVYLNTTPYEVDSNWHSTFNVTANFLGYSSVKARLYDGRGDIVKESTDSMRMTVVRQMRPIDHAFTYSVATLVSIIYINMGCALDWAVLRQTLVRPIGPLVGFVSQFIFMPLIAFGVGKLLFPLAATLQLGMFVTGCSPGGGASNIWTLTLGGNLNLSITMTTLSTLAAFVMIPVWTFTLGQLIFNEADIGIPYDKIGTFATALIIPLGIGLLIQRFLPRVSKWMVRILKPFALFLIVFIIVFAVYTNLYLFQLFSWQIVVAGLGLPWLGYCFGAGVSKLFHLPWEDLLAVAIETGIQNTGLAIFMLRFTLQQPEADLTTVIPVSVAIMTPIPLLIILLIQKVCRHQEKKKSQAYDYMVAPIGATPITVLK